MTVTIATNAMWEAVKDHARPSDYDWDHGALMVGQLTDPDWLIHPATRRDLCSRYAWTVTSPDTVAFVVEHAGPRLLDPMAGTGWWAHLLTEAGVDVSAFDKHPPGSDGNHWHKEPHTHHPVAQVDGAVAAAQHGTGRTLLLAWPPYDDPAGTDILTAYPGDRVIYIGEGDGGCTGGDAMHELLAERWIEVASHRPVQWFGIHDYVTVYNRWTRRRPRDRH